MTLKEQLLDRCAEFISQKIITIEETIADLKIAANNETKSSVGDKFETGRAMLQLEIEKNAAQLKVWKNQLSELKPLNSGQKSSKVEFSAIVKCTNANYFIAQACGKFKIENETYFSISVSAPIFRSMSGKYAGEQFSFNGQQVRILEIL